MEIEAVHHVAVATRDLERSRAFYCGVLGLKPIARPDFAVGGTWLGLGATEVHLVVHPEATFRGGAGIDANDGHFALRVADFDAALAHLARHGFSEDAPEGSGQRILLRRSGPAGFPQAYLLDPDGHVVEINARA